MDNRSIEANKALIRRYLDDLSGQPKTEASIKRYVSDPALIDHVLEFEAGFPNYELLLDDMIAEGEKVVVRFHSRQRHDGTFMGFPPTGKEFSIPGIIIYRIEDGLIAEHWIHVDTFALVQNMQAEEPQSVAAS